MVLLVTSEQAQFYIAREGRTLIDVSDPSGLAGKLRLLTDDLETKACNVIFLCHQKEKTVLTAEKW